MNNDTFTTGLHNQKKIATLIEKFSEITDPRIQARCDYTAALIIFTTFVAILCNASNYVAIAAFVKAKEKWFRKYIVFPEKTPTHDTYSRFFEKVNFREFSKILNSIIIPETGNQICIDGKAIKAVSSTDVFILVRAWSAKNNRVVAQQKVESGLNEIKAIHHILDSIDIKGKIVTIDAIGTQKNIVQKIVNKGGSYILPVKQNQRNLYENIQLYFADFINGKNTADDYHETVEKDHGRIEKRQCWVVRNIFWIPGYKKWKRLNQIICVRSEVSKKGKTTISLRYFITNSLGNAQEMLQSIRNHWFIENKLHWQRDVNFQEDRSTIRDFLGIQNMSFMRAFCLYWLRLVSLDSLISINLKRMLACADDDQRLKILVNPMR